MAKITIYRTQIEMPGEGALNAIRSFLFGFIEGFTKEDRRAWGSFWRRIRKMQPGEMAQIEIVFPRSGPFHRRHMKIEQTLFDNQDRFTNFEMFRDWLKIGAAWVVWVPGAKGGIVPLPKSISYAKAEEEEFRQFHQQVMEFLHDDYAAPYLWRHLGEESHEMMRVLLQEFGE